jgi:hypothetical protein
VSNCTYIVVDNLTVPGNTTLNLAKVGRVLMISPDQGKYRD